MRTRTSPSADSLNLTRSAAFGLLIACAVAVVAAAQQPSQILGKTNLHGWIDDAPGLPSSLDAALAQKTASLVNGGAPYRPFYDRVDAFKNAYKQAIASKSKPDEAATRKAAEAQANSNLARLASLPAVTEMGGLDRLALMSPEQRAQAAQSMMQNMRQNPAGPAGNGAAGMEGLMRKMMSDPAYRVRYEKMSQAEKESELRQFVGGSSAPAAGTIPQANADPRQPSPRVQAGNEVATTMAIRRDLERMILERGALDTAFATKDAEITASKGSHRDISGEAAVKLEKIPMVNDVIMGRVHDLDQSAALNKETATRHRERANWELQQRTALFSEQKLKLKALASEYQNWLKANQDKINTSVAPEDLLRAANTEIEVAGFEQGFVDAAYDLAKYAEFVTRDVASYEEAYRQGSAAIGIGKSK